MWHIGMPTTIPYWNSQLLDQPTLLAPFPPLGSLLHLQNFLSPLQQGVMKGVLLMRGT